MMKMKSVVMLVSYIMPITDLSDARVAMPFGSEEDKSNG